MRKEYLFVYGTLKRDFNHPMHKILEKYALFAGEGFVYGKLYKISWYPGLKLSLHKKDKVYGEVYLLKNPKKVFEILDRYEECSKRFSVKEYKRVKIYISTPRIKLKGWIYKYIKKTSANLRINSGVF
ncbi:MAG: gamma-glutamylcyclotransferase [Epsilonproteobacteria bacterium]|nr:gamma-glutamylcyclotransferase [Campylobacterota bacterium]